MDFVAVLSKQATNLRVFLAACLLPVCGQHKRVPVSECPTPLSKELRTVRINSPSERSRRRIQINARHRAARTAMRTARKRRQVAFLREWHWHVPPMSGHSANEATGTGKTPSPAKEGRPGRLV